LRVNSYLARALNSRPSFGQGSDDTFIQSPYLGKTDKRGNQKSMEKASTLCAGYSKAPSDGDYIKVKQVGTRRDSNNGTQPYQQDRVYDAEGIVPALNQGKSDLIIKNNYRIRRLTPIECERLQGFPDNHTAFGNYDGQVKPMSNTQRYKQCGNAVTVDVVQAVAEQCKPLFK